MNIYQHFRPEEREFIDQVLQWKEFVENSYSSKLTDFLDPREQQIIKTIIGTQSEIKVAFFGGLEENERKRALIYPDYLNVDKDDFNIQLFEIEYATKFITIEHPQVLGSLMGLGLKRGKFGDILIQNDRVQFLLVKEISDYIQMQLTHIGRSSISLKEIPLAEGMNILDSWQEVSTTVSSLRLDTVLSTLLNISRQRSQEYIKSGRVKVNWTTIENPAFDCDVADMISVRGHGRSKIISIEGRTKKDKLRIIAGKQR
ncbi:RNA-binding protein [Robertmurraya kyonggiensis]|uniref:RNA-binding protein n=1 Tax=Robertmurraya kyonggiensis TaxID=1037680 RepID=A0A4U1D7L8_9BACI|nr:RNA-binding protein [Robertmurraya kyonggiensis]TKC18589.1 RNA-binding protein [Robertmurraya kyonggiensis]